MAELLLGSTSEGTGAAVTITKPIAFRFKAKPGGTLTEIKVKLAAGSTATACRVGICVDGAGGKKPGALLTGTNEKEAAISAEAVDATLLSVEGLTEGTFYWLVVTPVSGNIKVKRSATEPSAIAENATTTISAVTGWKEETTGPMHIEGLGTKATIITVALAVTVKTAATVERRPELKPALKIAVTVAATFHQPSRFISEVNITTQARATVERRIQASPAMAVTVSMTATVTFPLVKVSPESESTYTGKNVALHQEVPEAWSFTPTKSAIARALRIRANQTVAGPVTVEAGIAEDEGGKPGEIIATGSVTLPGGTTLGQWIEIPLEPVGIDKGFMGAGEKFWEVVRSLVQFTTLHESTGGGTVTWKALKTAKKLTEVIASEWSEGSVTTENNGRQNAIVLGKLTPQFNSTPTVRVAVTATLERKTSVASSLNTLVAVMVGEPGSEILVVGGGHVRSHANITVQVKATISRTALAAAAITVTVEVASELSEGAIKTNVYFGPPAEEAAERARLAEESKHPPSSVPGSRFMDIFPAKTVQPLIIVIHGGGWVVNQWAETKEFAETLGPGVFGTKTPGAGFAVCHVNYRDAAATTAGLPMQLEDLEEAISYAIAHAATFNGSTSKVFLVGGSAGGHLAAMVAQRINARAEGTIKGVTCLSGIFDLQLLAEEMETGAYHSPHTGGKANEFIEHTQEALGQTLDYKGPVETTPPIVAGKTLTTAGRATQDLYSPSRTASTGPCKYLLWNCEKDLIPNSQPEGFNTHLLGEAKPVTLNIVAGLEGHAFKTLWGHKAFSTGTKTVKDVIVEWIVAPEFISAPKVTVTVSATVRRETSVASAPKVTVAVSAPFARAIASTIRCSVLCSATARREAQVNPSLSITVAAVAPVRRETSVNASMTVGVSSSCEVKTIGAIRSSILVVSRLSSATSHKYFITASGLVNPSGVAGLVQPSSKAAYV